MFGAGMNAETTPHCTALGFDDKRIQEVLSMLRLGEEHRAIADRIRTQVIAGRADELVDRCFTAFARTRGFSLIERSFGAKSFKRAWINRLRRFGLDFDTKEYFEERLATAAAFARAKIHLSLLHLPYFLTQEILIEALSEKFNDRATTLWPFLNAVLKLTSLDLYLTAEGYRLPELDELEGDLDKLRQETFRLRRRTSIDELTGLMNYAKLMESLEQQINRARRRGHESNPLCLIMSDLDFFKKINDTYGHMVGDLVLRHVAGRIKSATRDFDLIGRFGGEEFVIVMMNTDLALGEAIAERIREGVMKAPFHVKQYNIPVTLSLGVAMLRQGENKESLLERADAAMYEAKRSGRNRVVVASDS
ncbi:diguanylate cyclase (GGDEF) domain-containing protein [Nitrosospira briensis]|uniref:diguanylate cyclase n=2 Tax=Nitrosospira briensis TaxID=35799 RepID=A0A1I4YKC3_9PROT|nr:diguanylate cyclase (GGDEF) domain-containing protein [Nitrosospira briensis]